MPRRLSKLAVDDILVPVNVTVPTGANPSTIDDVVEIALVPGGQPPRRDPLDSEWQTGFWTSNGLGLFATLTVGPGTAFGALEPGRWAVWVKVVDNPTTPVACVDTITVY